MNDQLTFCESCQREIDSRVVTCPHCKVKTLYGRRLEMHVRSSLKLFRTDDRMLFSGAVSIAFALFQKFIMDTHFLYVAFFLLGFIFLGLGFAGKRDAAITRCPWCRREITHDAEFCIHCEMKTFYGYYMDAKRTTAMEGELERQEKLRFYNLSISKGLSIVLGAIFLTFIGCQTSIVFFALIACLAVLILSFYFRNLDDQNRKLI